MKRSKGQDRKAGGRGGKFSQISENFRGFSSAGGNFPVGAGCTNCYAMCAICTLHNPL